MDIKRRSYQKFYAQKREAYKRNIPWNITYEEWYNWWLKNGVDKDLDFEPMNKDKLCMCRFNDSGPYQLDNIYCATNSENVKLRNAIYHSTKEDTFVAEDKIFYSARAAAKALGVHYNTIRNRMIKQPNQYYYKK